MADKENSPEKQSPAEAGKGKVVLPVLVEFTITISVIVLIVLFFAVTGISLLTGAKLLDIVLRTGVTLLVIGVLLMLISRQIFTDVLNPGSFKQERGNRSEVDQAEGMENGRSKVE